MFAVPGWSLSADKLRAETVKLAPADQPAVAPPSTSDAAPGDGPTKKRKRPGRGPKVTDDNVADLWERVIEKKKRQGKKAETAAAEPDSSEARQPEAAQQADAVQQPPAKKAKKGEQTAASKESVEAKSPAAAEPAKKAPKAQDKPAKGTKERTAAAAPVTANSAEEKPAAKEQQQLSAKKGNKAQKGGDNKGKAAAKGAVVQSGGEKQQQKQPKAKTAAAAAAATETAAKETSSALTKTTTKTTAPATAAVPPPKLTPLQASMRAKLVSARFRHLNETLYTRPSEEALRLFADAPDMFQAYHEGFRQQVAVWPSNPVDTFVEEVQRRAGKAVNGGKAGKKAPMFRRGNANATSLGDTLPRTRGTCHIVDVGCGDARLAASLAPTADRLRVQVLSYDLHADKANRHITAAADAADLPLPSDAADIVVFCLALMGTNWLDFVEEAYRVLRWKGELWVAEIKSRFAGAAELRAGLKKRGAGTPVSHSVGYRRKMAGGVVTGKGGRAGGKNAKGGKNEKADEDDPEVVAAALAEVDGWDDGGGATTDVSSFVNALRRRGFVLDDSGAASADVQGSPAAAAKAPAVDLDNKMFVRMRFLKAAPAVIGKQAAPGAVDAARKKPKFLDNTHLSPEEAMEDPAFEAKILKPCVYKLR